MATAGTSGRPTVLPMNDDTDALDMYRVGLRTSGFDAVAPTDTTGALRERERLAPDLVVADLSRHDAGARRLPDGLKGEPPDGPVPRVLLTASPDPAIQSCACQLGCAAVLLEPCAPDDLSAIARQLLESRPPLRHRE